MNEYSILGLVILIPIVVLVAASIVTIFVATNKTIRAVAAICLLSLFLFVILAMLLVPAFTMTKQQVIHSTPSATTVASTSTPWNSSTEEALGASIYSSPESAARALAQSCLQTLQATMSEPPSRVNLVVHEPAEKWAPALETRLAAFVREQLPLSDVSHAVSLEPPPAEDEVLTIFVDLVGVDVTTTAPWDMSSEHATGQARLHGTYQDEEYDDLRRFVQKPWVDHFDEFVSQRPDRRLMRANSAGFALTEQESDRSARQRAAELLSPLVQQSPGAPRGRALELAVQSALDSDDVIIDRFSQKLSSQSGDVWRTTLLLDARPEMLTSIISSPRSTARRYQIRQRSAWIGIGVVLALTVFLYFVLDELTKGYFVWNLRVTALLTMLTLAIVFCWWMNAMT